MDFTAEKDGRAEYFQVCLTMLDDSTYQREVRSLKAIDDNYPETGTVRDYQGILGRYRPFYNDWLLTVF